MCEKVIKMPQMQVKFDEKARWKLKKSYIYKVRKKSKMRMQRMKKELLNGKENQ